jgi:tRNA pseudouridine38-40 synthase
MRTLKLTIAYDGTDFHGWQIQPGLPTIQGELERAVHEIEGKPVTVHGSGRTDAGVHALAQVASLTIENPIPAANLRRAINRLLPPSIRVLAVDEAAPGFHARYAARSKLYEYRLWRGEICPPMLYRYVHHHPYPLNLEAMQAAAPCFEGTHDFRSLAVAEDLKDGESAVRTVLSSRLILDPEQAVYRVEGSGFLHHMVRNIVGTLLEVGRGNLASSDIQRILMAANRNQAGPTAPAKGLALVQVFY